MSCSITLRAALSTALLVASWWAPDATAALNRQGEGTLPSLESVVNVPVNGNWVVLEEVMELPPSGGRFYSPIYTFSTSLSQVRIDVTDLYAVSDRNELWFGLQPSSVLIGATPVVPDWPSLPGPPNSAFDPPYTSDPNVAWLDPAFSKASFFLTLSGSGTYYIRLKNIHIPPIFGTTPFDTGTVAFRIVPEPTTGMLLAPFAIWLARRRRNARRGQVLACAMIAALAAAHAAPVRAEELGGGCSGTCGVIGISVNSGVLTASWASASSNESLRVLKNGQFIEFYSPASAATPCASVDTVACAVTAIRVEGGSGDDQIIFDDSGGSIVLSIPTEIDGGDGANILAGGVNLTALPLATLLADVQQFRADVLNTIPESRVEDLIDAGAGLVDTAHSTMIQPGVQCAQNVRPALVEPMRQIVRDTVEQEIMSWVNFVANDAKALQQQAEALKTNIDANVIDIADIMIPMAWNLKAAGEALVTYAEYMGTSPQSGSPDAFLQTVENYIVTIEFWANLCNDPTQPPNDPNDGDEDNQPPSGLPFPCDELEELIEQLEGVVDMVEARNDAVEAQSEVVEAMADEEAGGAASIEAVGNTLETNVDSIETDIETMETDAETLESNAEQKADAQEAWGAGIETTLANGGGSIEQCLQGVDNAAAALEAAAAAFEATAMTIPSDIETLLSQPTIDFLTADPVLALDDPRGIADCDITTNYKIIGGPGTDIIIGTLGNGHLIGGGGVDLIVGGFGNDLIEGGDDRDLLFGGGGNNVIYGETKLNPGDDADLLVGGNKDDCLFGGGGIDLLIGRGGVDRMHGQDKIDVLFGGGSGDRMYGGAGETRTVLSLKFDLGNLFFGEGGDDLIVGGDENPSDPNAPNLLPGIDIAFGMAGDDRILVGDGGNFTTTASQPPCPFPVKLGNLVFGGTGKDTIVAKDGIDVLFGGPDDDTITAGKGHVFTFDCNHNSRPELKIAFGDLVFGRAGDDTIHGDDPAADRANDDIDLLFGGDGDDTINGYGGGKIEVDADEDGTNDFEMRLGNLAFGGDGDDTIKTGKGIDVLFGGPGEDHIEAGYGDRLKFSDTVVIDFGDIIFGQGDADTIHGDKPTAPATTDPSQGEVDGIDLIFAGDGIDVVYSSDGGLFAVGDISDPSSITLAFTFGNIVFGGEGGDQLFARYENPSTSGGDDHKKAGIDVIFGGPGDDEIEGGKGSIIYVSPAATPTLIPFGNMLFGGVGADTIRGAGTAPVPAGILPVDPGNFPVPDGNLGDYLDGMDLIFAGPDDDDVESYSGIDFVFGGKGDDQLVAEHGGVMLIAGVPIPFGNLMFGSAGEDVIESEGRELLLEVDLLFGGPCDDTISAGGGFINLAFGGRHNDTITADGAVTTINLLFGNRADDTLSTTGIGINLLFGNRGRDTINAGAGVNVCFGNRDDDVINGGLGLNLLFGNRGNDTVNGGNDSLGLYLLFGNRGSDTVQGGNGLNLAFGNACNDVVIGGIGVNMLFGNRGDDQVSGGVGLTLSFGNRDNDRLTAGSGMTLNFGNRGHDRLVMGGGLGLAFGGHGDDIICGGSGKLIAFGGRDNDVIHGGGGLNILFGNANDDWIAGGDNATDIIFGNRGNDTIFGRGGPLDLLFGNADNDQIDGEGGKDFVFGNRGDDDLQSGGGGNDFVFGNRGNDRVYSGPDGSGGDKLFGNRGNDTVDGHPGGSCGVMSGCADCRFGGRGTNTRSCNGNSISFNNPNPRHGVIRGFIKIDRDNDNVGDIGHGGVTVTLTGNSLNLSTTSLPDNADCYSDAGAFSFVGLPPGNYTICQTPPAGYAAVAPPSGCVNVTVDATCGGGLVDGLMLVNRSTSCSPTADGFGCEGPCPPPPQPISECRPTRLRRVDRCPITNAICDSDNDCPCGTSCEPSWEVVECGCVPDPECYVNFNPATDPGCGGVCIDGTPCGFVQSGDTFHCRCDSCGTELASFTLSGVIHTVQGCPPTVFPPIGLGDHWRLRYWFSRFSGDMNPSPQIGEYAVVHYELRVNSNVVSAGPASPSSTIRVFDDSGGLTGTQDAYEVRVETAASPLAGFLVRLVNQSTAIGSDALLQCGDLDLAAFTGCCGGAVLPPCTVCGAGLAIAEPCRCFVWQTSIAPNCPDGFRVRGSVDSLECLNCAPLLMAGCPGDLNFSGAVDADDAPLFVAELLSAAPCGNGCRGDVDRNGAVDGGDIQWFVSKVIAREPCR